ncbi:hypothetical protein [Ferriphaselus sp. R-1]|uniref:hypothetical protein n=1 Tax=Ferriphaselus sp. R-1 TaxID=1485544 RepID=UPI001267FDDE|nr:hypothetical protein [Ferriphaselus sp. R-1]
MRKVIQYMLLLIVPVASASCSNYGIPYGQLGSAVQREEKFLYGRPGVFVYFMYLPSPELKGVTTQEKNIKRAQYIKEKFRQAPSIAPPGCLGEIEVIGWGDSQGGNSNASFRCLP